jgi:deoxyribodipyrimidine photo-lyase
MIRSILWFRQDLRLHDNEALVEAVRNSDELIPVYIFDPGQFAAKTKYNTPKTSWARTQFLIESVQDIRHQLRRHGSELVVRIGKPEEILFSLAADNKAHYIYCNRERTREEVDAQDHLEKKLWTIGREVRYSRGKMLYYTSDLPFPVTHCPDSFVSFKKEVEQYIPVRTPLKEPERIAPFPGEIDHGLIPSVEELLGNSQDPQERFFAGGETSGLIALKNGVDLPSYFSGSKSTMLSPWIAMGCLSPKKVFYEAFGFESGSEDVQQHLLYRDYLRLMAKKYGDLIFHKSGTKGIHVKTMHDPVSLEKWQNGLTGIDIIDAGMGQLNRAGWLPDNIRRLVSSYFIKVLNLDWRLGAAYFESRLIDYDPSTNWVSWLNMAGLGPDIREDRIVNYEAMGKRIDPEGVYVAAWHPQVIK